MGRVAEVVVELLEQAVLLQQREVAGHVDHAGRKDLHLAVGLLAQRCGRVLARKQVPRAAIDDVEVGVERELHAAGRDADEARLEDHGQHVPVRPRQDSVFVNKDEMRVGVVFERHERHATASVYTLGFRASQQSNRVKYQST